MAANAKTFVVDASATLAFLLSEGNEKIDQKFRDHSTNLVKLISVPLLPYEVMNSLKMAVIRKRIDKELAVEIAQTFLSLEISIMEIDPKKCLDLSLEENLTYYDASYLLLSLEHKQPLLSLDKHLEKFALK